MKAQCVPAAIKVRKLSTLRQDSDLTVYLSSDEEGSSIKTRSADVGGGKKLRGAASQSSLTSIRSNVSSKLSEVNGKTSPVVKSIQKKITDYKMSSSPKVQTSDVALKENGHVCELEKTPTLPEKTSTKRSKEYTFVNFNSDIEDQIKKCS